MACPHATRKRIPDVMLIGVAYRELERMRENAPHKLPKDLREVKWGKYVQYPILETPGYVWVKVSELTEDEKEKILNYFQKGIDMGEE